VDRPSLERPISGSCLCGAVRFQITAPFLRANFCHCSRCRKHSGAGGLAQGRVPREAFKLLAGGELIEIHRPPGGMAKAFCRRCGSSLFGGTWPDGPEVSVRLGSLDADPGIRPQYHSFVTSKAAWETLPDDGLPRFEGPPIPRRERVSAATDQPTAEEMLKRLEPLVGAWRLALTLPGGERWGGEATATFDWHDSRSHLVQRSIVEVPQAPDSTSIIGCDAAHGTYYQLYSDERGVCRVYGMSIGDGEWRLWRQGQPFAQRFTARFEDANRKIVGRWEKAEDGINFSTDFDLTYTRID
jgi:hypothetical protein